MKHLDWADVFNWLAERIISLYTASLLCMGLALVALLGQQYIEGAIFFVALAIYLRMIADKHEVSLAVKKMKDAGFEGVLVIPKGDDEDEQ